MAFVTTVVNKKPGWFEALRSYTRPRALIMLFLGFSSGLPILLVFGTLSVWLREAGIDRATIGFVSWVALAYGFKWVWSPLVDRVSIPLLSRLLGRRRGWLLLSQLTVLLAILGIASTDPQVNLHQLVWFALLTAFASATQDIVIDAYRIESAESKQQATLAATYMIGYRIAMIFASAGVLWIAAFVDQDESTYQYQVWYIAYGVMALLMLVGLITTLVAPEPNVRVDDIEQVGEQQGGLLSSLQGWVRRAVINPFGDFFRRYGWHAVLILALISTYRISDIVLGVIANVFYVDMGFSKEQIANVTKVFGITMTLIGAFAGGLMVYRFGVMRILMLGAILSAATNLLFAQLATMGASISMLIGVVAMDNLSGGLATAAFVAYLSGLTNVSYSATQYALFSSIMLLFPKFLGGFSGVVVEQSSYPTFFIMTAVIGLPVLILVYLATRYARVDTEVMERVG